jgi:hypothetical protein
MAVGMAPIVLRDAKIRRPTGGTLNLSPEPGRLFSSLSIVIAMSHNLDVT